MLTDFTTTSAARPWGDDHEPLSAERNYGSAVNDGFEDLALLHVVQFHLAHHRLRGDVAAVDIGV